MNAAPCPLTTESDLSHGMPRVAETEFTLMCNALKRTYDFSSDGKRTWTHFVSIDVALAYMGMLITATTPLSVCNENGQEFILVDVYPRGW